MKGTIAPWGVVLLEVSMVLAPGCAPMGGGDIGENGSRATIAAQKRECRATCHAHAKAHCSAEAEAACKAEIAAHCNAESTTQCNVSVKVACDSFARSQIGAACDKADERGSQASSRATTVADGERTVATAGEQAQAAEGCIGDQTAEGCVGSESSSGAPPPPPPPGTSSDTTAATGTEQATQSSVVAGWLQCELDAYAEAYSQCEAAAEESCQADAFAACEASGVAECESHARSTCVADAEDTCVATCVVDLDGIDP